MKYYILNGIVLTISVTTILALTYTFAYYILLFQYNNGMYYQG